MGAIALLVFYSNYMVAPLIAPLHSGDARLAAWSYREAYPEVGRISGLVSFDPDIVSAQLDDTQLRLEPGQTVIPHGPDRELTVAEASARR